MLLLTLVAREPALLLLLQLLGSPNNLGNIIAIIAEHSNLDDTLDHMEHLLTVNSSTANRTVAITPTSLLMLTLWEHQSYNFILKNEYLLISYLPIACFDFHCIQDTKPIQLAASHYMLALGSQSAYLKHNFHCLALEHPGPLH